ncbi:hypothetical protein G4V62_03235 [Bacillaceae bacterium SIJ1]|nr:hypothetical protein [Litoribacterium kuwaitense]NGP44009.1 hypothetical protein [Litoribacterium kuwaitense]
MKNFVYSLILTALLIVQIPMNPIDPPIDPPLDPDTPTETFNDPGYEFG